MDHTHKLEEYEYTFAHYQELRDLHDLEAEVECLRVYAHTFSDDFTEQEMELWKEVDGMYEVAKDYLEAIAKAELEEELRDQAKYTNHQ